MKTKRIFAVSVFLLGLVLSLLINYHSYVVNFNLVPGDRGDTRLMVFTLEHWLSVLKGHQAFFVLNAFYPSRLALAYADGLFLFAVPYVILRLAGLDYFTSYQLLLVVMTAVGYAAWWIVLRRMLRLEQAFASLGALLLTSLNSMQLQVDIGKMVGFYFCPLLILLLYDYSQAGDKNTWKDWLRLVAFGSLLALLFFTSYYPAWFFLFTLVLIGIVSLVASWVEIGLGSTVRRTTGLLRSDGPQFAAGLVAFAVCLSPFIITYAPLVLSNSKRGFGLVLDFSPRVVDIVNVSSLNYVWSPVLNWFHFAYGNHELQMGSPILVLALFMAYYASLLLRWRRSGPGPFVGPDRLVFLLSTTALVIIALTVQVRGLSLWYGIYKVVPGASALRALGRYLMVVDMLVILVAIYGLNAWYVHWGTRSSMRGRLALAACLLLGIALIGEEINGLPFRLDKAAELETLNRYAAAPTGCQAFYIFNAPTADLPIGYYELDAMMAGMKLDLPTANGYSGFAPDEVFTMVPAGVEYKYYMLKWLEQQDATNGICELSYVTGALSPVDVKAELPKYRDLNRTAYLDSFTELFRAAQSFLADQNEISNLYPQFLEEHGYLPASYGYDPGNAFRWMQGHKYWIGERACGSRQCVGIGIAGHSDDLGLILDVYGGRANRIYFPEPAELRTLDRLPDDQVGELLLLFRPEDLSP